MEQSWSGATQATVNRLHVPPSPRFPGATKSGTFADAGQSLVRDLCRHRRVKTTAKQSPITSACTTKTDPTATSPAAESIFMPSGAPAGALSLLSQKVYFPPHSPLRGMSEMSHPVPFRVQPYANGSYILRRGKGPLEEFHLYCSCGTPPAISHGMYSVTRPAHDRGYGSPEEIVLTKPIQEGRKLA